MYIDEAHTLLDIFRFAIFVYLYSVSLGDALTTAAMRPFFLKIEFPTEGGSEYHSNFLKF